MKIVALLSWFDENPEYLGRHVLSWSRLCDAVVAVDGPYKNYPARSGRSHPDQAAVIQHACAATEMECLLFSRDEPWETQIAKRSFTFRAAEAITGPGDWLLSIDGDEELGQVPPDARERLHDTPLLAAEIMADYSSGGHPQRRLLRALPGLRAEGRHFRIVTRRGIALWDEDHRPQVTALAMHDLTTKHHRELRSPERLAAQKAYYRTMEEW